MATYHVCTYSIAIFFYSEKFHRKEDFWSIMSSATKVATLEAISPAPV